MQLEKVILYLKNEMQILSEQLGNLQNILVSIAPKYWESIKYIRICSSPLPIMSFH